MKKTIVLLALIMAMSLCSSVFAADLIPGTAIAGNNTAGTDIAGDNTTGTDIAGENTPGTILNGDNNDTLVFDDNITNNTDELDADSYNYTTGEAAYGTFGIAPRLNFTSDTEITFAAGELFLVDTTTKQVLLPDTRLEPGTEYEFWVFMAYADHPNFDINTPLSPGTLPGVLDALKEEDVIGSGANRNTNARLRLSRVKNSNGAVSDIDLEVKGSAASRYFFVTIETKDTYDTKLNEVSYSLIPNGAWALTAPTVIQSGFSVEVGYDRMTAEEAATYDEEDIVNITNAVPVILKKQIETIVKANNYKAVELEFEDGSWRYKGRMSGMGDTNFYTTHEAVPSIMNKFDQDFKFLSLPGGATFPTNGEMRIDVSDISEDWERIYTYLYRNGRLTPINTSYDSDEDMIYFRTNYLGAFVMTDAEITDTTILEETPNEESIPPETSPGTQPGGNNNPPTGVPAGMNLIVGLGAISLLCAGTVVIRKKK